jgi:cation:H+ antiporter
MGVGAEVVVVVVEEIAATIGIAEDVIALTVVALGTSLPELAVTISAAKKKKYGIVLGNVIGSNIFNLLCVIGIPTVIGYLSGKYYIISDAVFTGFGIPLMLLATVLVFVLSLLKSTPKIFGYLFVALYFYFIVGSFLKLSL